MNGLELVSTDKLLNELFSRFDHVIFHGAKFGVQDKNVYERKYAGNYPICIGLCELMKDCIINDFEDDMDYEEPHAHGEAEKETY